MKRTDTRAHTEEERRAAAHDEAVKNTAEERARPDLSADGTPTPEQKSAAYGVPERQQAALDAGKNAAEKTLAEKTTRDWITTEEVGANVPVDQLAHVEPDPAHDPIAIDASVRGHPNQDSGAIYDRIGRWFEMPADKSPVRGMALKVIRAGSLSEIAGDITSDPNRWQELTVSNDGRNLSPYARMQVGDTLTLPDSWTRQTHVAAAVEAKEEPAKADKE